MCRERSALVGLSSELIAVLDRCDVHTRAVVESELRGDTTAVVLPVDFGDLGEARNAGMARASGEYGCTVDGDDLISSNWLVAAHRRTSGPGYTRVVHPDYVLEFGAGRGITRLPDMDTDELPLAALLTCHPWTSCAFAPISAYRESPYPGSTGKNGGYGFEDWHWNLGQIALGRRHVTAGETVLFYRKRPDSLLVRQIGTHRIVAPTPFFSAEFFPRLIGASAPAVSEAVDSMASAPTLGNGRATLWHRWRGFWSRLTASTPDASKPARNLSAKPPPLPPWILSAATEMSTIESEIPADAERLSEWKPWAASLRSAPGEVYAKLLSQIAAHGALAAIALDVEPVRYETTYWPGAVVQLVTQAKQCSNLADEMVTSVDSAGERPCVLDISGDLGRLTEAEAQAVLVRLLVQLRPRVVLVRDGVGRRVVELHARALSAAGVEVRHV